MAASRDDYRWLVSEAALPWLQLVRDELTPGGCEPSGEPRQRVSVGLLARLRKGVSAERAHLIIEQVELRRRGREKFVQADQMFFTRKGLEQATDEQLAEYKAARIPAGQPSTDLCCGIGGDLLALAQRGKVTGVDLDPVAAIFAAANAAAHGISQEGCCLLVQDAAETELASVAAWHCDPDRRAEGKRTTRVETFAPSFDALHRLLASNHNAAIKLAPATEAPAAWAETAELEWLGSRGECRQQVAWYGALARYPRQRAATVVEPSGESRTICGQPDEPIPPAAILQCYLYEPHAALLAARLTGVVCREHDLSAISAGIAYLTSDRRIADAALAAFEVTDVLPLDRKQLKAYCREHGIGRLEVKKRGVEIDPDRLRKEIIAGGENEATLIVSPVAGQTRAIIARRLA